MNEDRKKEITELLNNWREAVKKVKEELGPTFEEREFTFSLPEQKQLTKIYTLQFLAQQLFDDLLNENVLKRVGITPSREIHLKYELGVGRFVVFFPKDKLSSYNPSNKSQKLPKVPVKENS